MKSLPFDTLTFKQSLIDAGTPDKQADALTQAFSKAIQQSNENFLEQIKLKYQLDSYATKHDLKLLDLKQDDSLSRMKHELEMQRIQVEIEESKCKTKYWQNLLIAFYVFETLVIAILLSKI